MKTFNTIFAVILLFLTNLTFSPLFGQNPDATYTNVNSQRVYFDGKDPKFYQPHTGTSFSWPSDASGDYLPLYFVYSNGSPYSGQKALLIADDLNDLSFQGTSYNGNSESAYTYTVNATSPVSGGDSDLGMAFYWFETTGGYGIIQFTTISQTGLDDPNMLDLQSNHFQIQDGQIFKVTFAEDPCESVSYQLIVTW